MSHQRSLYGNATVGAGQRHVQHLGRSTSNSSHDADPSEIEEFGLQSRRTGSRFHEPSISELDMLIC